VQGVGFRPTVYRLATTLGLGGWVINDSRGVVIEVEGHARSLDRFRERLWSEAPPLAAIESIEVRELEPAAGFERFEIRHSERGGDKTTVVLPDVATCNDCLTELREKSDRRYRYPFINCTNCGPRFTIVLDLPYDRPNTTMSGFLQCASCQREYDDPLDRRFHAQPNACAACGPRLTLLGRAGQAVARDGLALETAAEEIERGGIVALKGLGGFHLVTDAGSSEAVMRLRERKRRPHKPLALMVADLAAARELCEIGDDEARLLTSAEAPIVLLRRRAVAGGGVVENIAPGNPWLGLMLPCTPLHHLLLARLRIPLVATSGNVSDEPICTDERAALGRLGRIADVFLVHDRPIARHADDSIVAVIGGGPCVLRRARGLAPLPVLSPDPLPTIVAVGAHLKNAVALSVGRRVFVSKHIGDMDSPEAFDAFERVVADFLRLYEASPVAIAADLHPDYPTTRWAEQLRSEPAGAVTGTAVEESLRRTLGGLPVEKVQHHHAHLASCLADNGERGTVLGVTWDGAGFGADGTTWGGEFLLGDAEAYERVATFRPFRLLGGDAAAREPRRSAIALLHEVLGTGALDAESLPPLEGLGAAERTLYARMLESGLRSPLTSSAGRMFDAIASLAGLRQVASFEGQAAMELEFAAGASDVTGYRLPVVENAPRASTPQSPSLLVDWRPMIEQVLADLGRSESAATIAARFHAALADSIAEVARRVGARAVALTGGCFQNRRLTALTVRRLDEAGLRVLLHRQVPPGDGGISLGQIAIVGSRLSRGGASR
jgi:hydrogenase maturation protein HypF